MLELISINTNIRKCLPLSLSDLHSSRLFFSIGSGRVTFDNSSSFLHAVSTAFGMLIWSISIR